MSRLMAVWLFLRIVWRVADEQDGIVYRLPVSLAWQIAANIWLDKPYPSLTKENG